MPIHMQPPGAANAIEDGKHFLASLANASFANAWRHAKLRPREIKPTWPSTRKRYAENPAKATPGGGMSIPWAGRLRTLQLE